MRKLMTSRFHFKAVPWIAILATAVTLGACGADKPAQGLTEAGKSAPATGGGPAGSSIKACELMTQPEAEAAVGQALPKATENSVLGMCTRSADDFSAGADLTVGEWQSMKAAATSRSVPAPVSGVGDEALNLNGSNGSLLYVRKGSKGFLLVLNGPKIDHLPDHGLAREKDLASKIVSRLGG
ncbi:MAG TPA: hypothetical protein VGH73_09340 [Thermoanaerobaculia bacterium]